MATHSKFIKDESLFKVENGKLIETDSLGTNVAAKMNRTTGDLEAINVDETTSALDPLGNHINDNGEIWWNDPEAQVFGTEKTIGSHPWSIYKQTNIYTTARQYAGKDNQYGVHIFRYPNISSASTWGGLIIYPPVEAKIEGHTYRFSFDYRGQTGGANLDVYQNTETGWGSLGIGLPTPWGQSVSSFDTDWEWRRYEQEFTVDSTYLNWVPGSNQAAWNSTTAFSGGYRGITYNGYVYRLVSGKTTTLGVDPETEYQSGNGVYNAKYPMTAGYFDLYRQIKIGFTYNTQGNRGTHVYVDNIQLTDVTTNQRWKFNGNGWEADNLSEGTTHIFAKGTAHMGLDKGDGGDIFAVEGARVLEVNGTQIYNTASGRGLRLTIIDEATGNVDSDVNYDVHGSTTDRNNLAAALANIPSTKLWALTSYDAIGTSPGTALSEQMKAMGSEMLISSNALNAVSTRYDFKGNTTDGNGMYSAYNANENIWIGDVGNATVLFFDKTDKDGYNLEDIYFDIRNNDTEILLQFTGTGMAQTHTFQVDAFYRHRIDGAVYRYYAEVTLISSTGSTSNVYNSSNFEEVSVTFNVNTAIALEYSVYKGGSYRSPYAAIGRGQQIIKEDGSAQIDNVYKRKGVIDLRV